MVRRSRNDSETARMAAEAADRLAEGAAAGRQLALFPAAPSPAAFEPPEEGDRPGGPGSGRPKGARNRRGSRLREWLAHQGLMMPEDRLIEMAGLGDRDRTALEHAMAQAEQLLAWGGASETADPDDRVQLALRLLEHARRAATDLLPYGVAKVTPDVSVQAQAVVLKMPGGQPGDGARVVEGRASASGFAPPPLPDEIEEYQDLSESDDEGSDG